MDTYTQPTLKGPSTREEGERMSLPEEQLLMLALAEAHALLLLNTIDIACCRARTEQNTLIISKKDCSERRAHFEDESKITVP